MTKSIEACLAYADSLIGCNDQQRMFKAMAEALRSPRGTDAQILSEREITANAIDGAMTFGFQNTNPPPVGHWLEAWWMRGRGIAISEEARESDMQDAARYRRLRAQDLDTINRGGVFAGKTPDNVVLAGEDLDSAVDALPAGVEKT